MATLVGAKCPILSWDNFEEPETRVQRASCPDLPCWRGSIADGWQHHRSSCAGGTSSDGDNWWAMEKVVARPDDQVAMDDRLAERLEVIQEGATLHVGMWSSAETLQKRCRELGRASRGEKATLLQRTHWHERAASCEVRMRSSVKQVQTAPNAGNRSMEEATQPSSTASMRRKSNMSEQGESDSMNNKEREQYGTTIGARASKESPTTRYAD